MSSRAGHQGWRLFSFAAQTQLKTKVLAPLVKLNDFSCPEEEKKRKIKSTVQVKSFWLSHICSHCLLKSFSFKKRRGDSHIKYISALLQDFYSNLSDIKRMLIFLIVLFA